MSKILGLNGQELNSKDKFIVPEKYRITKPIDNPLSSDRSFGNNGAFKFNTDKNTEVCCIASDRLGWDYVSIQVIKNNRSIIPTWSITQRVKDLFWQEEAIVMQLYTKSSDYVNKNNNNNFILHLWRCQSKTIPTPPDTLVGI